MTELGVYGLTFEPKLNEFLGKVNDRSMIVLSGSNNTGKTLTLKFLKKLLGKQVYLVGMNRFYHIPQLTTAKKNTREVDQWETQFTNMFGKEEQNQDQNFMDLRRIMINFDDEKREILLSLCGELLGSNFEYKKLNPKNDLSPRYISIDNQNLSVSSTGTRLLMTLLGFCMDERFKKILIDEPELGLSPKLQHILAECFRNPDYRSKYFPHLEQIIIATHSHVFLDHTDIKNNFMVTKDATLIKLQQVKDINSFHRLQFNLLGNSLESMFFPAAIIMVEGKTDHAYLERIVELHLSGHSIVVIHANCDTEIKKKIAYLSEALGGLDKNPLGTRLFVVLDATHATGLKNELITMKVLEQNIIVWPRNGVEYYYPVDLLRQIFSCSSSEAGNLVIENDKITINNITKTKNELCEEIVKKLDMTTSLPSEINNSFLKLIKESI